MSTQPTSATPATPKTDAVAEKIGALAREWKRGNICAEDFAICAQAEINKLCTLETELAAEKATLQAEALHQIDEHSAQAKIMDRQRADVERLSNALRDLGSVISHQEKVIVLATLRAEAQLAEICGIRL